MTQPRVLLLLICLTVAACDGSSTSPSQIPTPTPTPTPAPTPTPTPTPTSTTTFQGTLAGVDQSGTVEITIQAEIGPTASNATVGPLGASDVSGSLRLVGGGGADGLSGNYEATTGQVTISGGGFELNATVDQGRSALDGTYSGPGGTSGSFATLNTGAGTVTNYCGTFSGTDSGTWNGSISGGSFSGSYAGQEDSGVVAGQVTGTSVRVTGSDGLVATGTVQGTSLSGSWGNDFGSGSFAGSTDACP